MNDQLAAWTGASTWQQRLDAIVELMREMSAQTDPQKMVAAYAQRVRAIQKNDGIIAVSRRGLSFPNYKVTRASAWSESVNPWTQPEKTPIYARGILGELLYADKARLIQDFRVPELDPAAALFGAARSIAVIPQYDGGEALNMVVVLRNEPNGFDPERFPEVFWQSNLFGRATSTLVLRKQVQEAYDAIDRELQVVADIQRSLLPTDLDLPTSVGLEVARYYQASKNAGGDYYDFFRLPGGKLGVLIADVSGHGTPAAVLMAILHAIAHMNQAWLGECQLSGNSEPSEPIPPREWLAFVNQQLCERYTRLSGTFVTAFYALYDPKTGALQYASAGHNPPRLRVADGRGRLSGLDSAGLDSAGWAGNGVSVGAGSGAARDGSLVVELDQAQGLPLGIVSDAQYTDATVVLAAGDELTLYTDGITEAMSATRELFGTERLDAVLGPALPSAQDRLDAILRAVRAHAGDTLTDDRTLMVVRVGAVGGA